MMSEDVYEYQSKLLTNVLSSKAVLHHETEVVVGLGRVTEELSEVIVVADYDFKVRVDSLVP